MALLVYSNIKYIVVLSIDVGDRTRATIQTLYHNLESLVSETSQLSRQVETERQRADTAEEEATFAKRQLQETANENSMLKEKLKQSENDYESKVTENERMKIDIASLLGGLAVKATVELQQGYQSKTN